MKTLNEKMKHSKCNREIKRKYEREVKRSEQQNKKVNINLIRVS